MQMTPRRVKIAITKHGYFVEYLDRKKGQRHCAAQFTLESEVEGVPRTIEDVKNWVKQQKHLTLDETLA